MVIVRADTNGNVFGYETIEPEQSKPKKLRRKLKPSRLRMSESDQLVQDNIDYEQIPIIAQSPKYADERTKKPRKIRYKPMESKVKVRIFDI